MESTQLNWIANFIWGIADDVLRDSCVRGKYRDIIRPMTVSRHEVLPYTPNAWDEGNKTKIGYEVSLTRHFSKSPALRSLVEIWADIGALEAETEVLMNGILMEVE